MEQVYTSDGKIVYLTTQVKNFRYVFRKKLRSSRSINDINFICEEFASWVLKQDYIMEYFCFRKENKEQWEKEIKFKIIAIMILLGESNWQPFKYHPEIKLIYDKLLIEYKNTRYKTNEGHKKILYDFGSEKYSRVRFVKEKCKEWFLHKRFEFDIYEPQEDSSYKRRHCVLRIE